MLEIIFKGFKGRKLVLRNCIFSNISSHNLEEMLGKKWLCYDSLRHFELSKASGLTHPVLNAIAEHLSRTTDLVVLKLYGLNHLHQGS